MLVDYVVSGVYQAVGVLESGRFDPVYIGPGLGTVLAAGHQTVGEDHPDRKQQPRITGFGGATPSLELPSIGNTVNLLFHDEYSYAENEAIASPESAEWNHALSEIVMAGSLQD